MKSDALREQGIEIVEQVPIPDELIPADAQVEMDAKKAAGYFTPKKPLRRPKLEKAKGRAAVERSEDTPADLALILAGSNTLRRSASGAARDAASCVEAGRVDAWWSVDANGLEAAVQATLAVTRKRFPIRRRFRSIRAGGISRPAATTVGPRWRRDWRPAEGRGRAPPHRSRGRRGAARCGRGAGLVLSRARHRRDLCALRRAGRGELPYVRQRRLQPRSQGRSAAGRCRAAVGADADGHRHGLPGEGAQCAGRPRRPRRPAAQAGRRRARPAGRAVRCRIRREGRRHGEGRVDPRRGARQAVADLAVADGRCLAASGDRLGAVPQALAMAVLLAGRADRGRRPRGRRARCADRPAGISQRRPAGRCRRAAAQAVEAADRQLQGRRRGDRRMARADGGVARQGRPSMCACISASMPSACRW